ncbi:MAG: peptidoglycan-binding protein [Rhodospirillales bacterium]|nr:peptidoglycan-binding protein [Rhodospirillales bacterium]
MEAPRRHPHRRRRVAGRADGRLDRAAIRIRRAAFLIYRNYRAILTWNRSLLYAVAVGHLADRLVGGGPLQSPRPPEEVPLSRADVQDLQRRLAAKGLYSGGDDGVVGPETRNAIKAYQRQVHLPPDGFPTPGLLERLRGTPGG